MTHYRMTLQVFNHRLGFISFIVLIWVSIIRKMKIRRYGFKSISGGNVLNSRISSEKTTVPVQRKHWQLICGHDIIYPKECLHFFLCCQKVSSFLLSIKLSLGCNEVNRQWVEHFQEICGKPLLSMRNLHVNLVWIFSSTKS